MSRWEWLLVTIVYLCTSLVALAVVVRVLPADPELALVAGAMTGTITAGLLYHRRDQLPSPFGFRILVGLLLALACGALGILAQAAWQPWRLPTVALPIAVVGTFFCPLVFPLHALVPKSAHAPMPDQSVRPSTILWISVAAVGIAVASVLLLPPRSNGDIALASHQLSGIGVSLPAWNVEGHSDRYRRGSLRALDPRGSGRFVEIRWETGALEPDALDRIWSGLGFAIQSRRATTVDGHEGSEIHFSNGTASHPATKHVAVTQWSCPRDGRWIQILTFVDEPEAQMLRLHRRVLASVKCHTAGDHRPEAPVFPPYQPPGGFVRDAQAGESLTFNGPAGELITLDPGEPGRIELLSASLAPEVVKHLIQAMGPMRRVDVSPTLRSVTDRQGEARRVWSITGSGDDGLPLQVELMVWYCARLDTTFVASYWTSGSHDAQQGIDILSRATCPP